MALSQNSKILIDDINTALSGKIDTAGTGLAKSGTSLSLASVVTAGTVGGASNATLSFGSTFTTPYVTYDAYGRVTGGGTRSLTMPSAPSVTNISGTAAKATATPNVACAYNSNESGVYAFNCTKGTGKATLPSGGTWRYMTDSSRAGQVSGGSSITISGTSGVAFIAIRVG